MRRILPFLAVPLFFAAPAFAQDEGNVIKIIRDDGSVVVIEMGDDGASTATIEGKSEPVPQAGGAAPADVPANVSDGQSYPRRQKPQAVSEEPPPPRPAAEKVKSKPAPKKKIKPPKPAPEREIPEGAAITQELATQIALDNAPPSMKFDVYRTALDGVQVFLVLFQTDEGPYEVVVDALSGKVLSRQHVRVEVMQTKPGHLPPAAPVPAGAVPVGEDKP